MILQLLFSGDGFRDVCGKRWFRIRLLRLCLFMSTVQLRIFKRIQRGTMTQRDENVLCKNTTK